MGTTHLTGLEVTGAIVNGGALTTFGDLAIGGSITGALSIDTAQFVKGQKFVVTFPNIAAASVGFPFFIAPAACKIVEARETHVTVCDAADTVTIEKLTAGEAPGNGDVTLAAAFALNSTANTAVTKAAVADGKEVLAAGNMLALKFASGDGTSYAGGCVVVTLVWT